MYNLLFWIGVQLLLHAGLASTSRSYRNTRSFKILFLPAVLLEGVARLVACCIAAVEVKSIDFFEDGKPFATPGKSRIPCLGGPLFVAVWLGLLYAVFHIAVTHADAVEAYGVTLPHVDAVAMTEGSIRIDARSYLGDLVSAIAGVEWSSWGPWLLVYVFMGAFPFFDVAGRHLRWGGGLIAGLALLTAVFDFLGMRPAFFSRGWFLTRWVLPDYFNVYSLFVSCLAITLVLHVGARLALRSARTAIIRSGGRKKGGEERRDGTKASKPKARRLVHS